MRFGRSAKEAAEEPGRGSGLDFIRYFKDGDTTIRILQEPDEWTYYWEHFGVSAAFPCTNEEDCPGCTSNNEKTAKAGRKIAFNALAGYNGQEYVNVYKVGTTVADKLKNRYERLGTVCDRDYTVTRYKTSGDRYDFDVEGGVQTKIDLSKYQLKDVEAMLQEQWNDVWGEGATRREDEPAQEAKPKRLAIAPTPKPEPKDDEPPFEEKVYQEAELRQMDLGDLKALIVREQAINVPDGLTTSDAVVDWLLEMQPS